MTDIKETSILEYRKEKHWTEAKIARDLEMQLGPGWKAYKKPVDQATHILCLVTDQPFWHFTMAVQSELRDARGHNIGGRALTDDEVMEAVLMFLPAGVPFGRLLPQAWPDPRPHHAEVFQLPIVPRG